MGMSFLLLLCPQESAIIKHIPSTHLGSVFSSRDCQQCGFTDLFLGLAHVEQKWVGQLCL